MSSEKGRDELQLRAKLKGGTNAIRYDHVPYRDVQM
jgi:hypothetical protein